MDKANPTTDIEQLELNEILEMVEYAAENNVSGRAAIHEKARSQLQDLLTQAERRGQQEAKRNAVRDFSQVMAALLQEHGGRLEISRDSYLTAGGEIETWDDPATGKRVYRLVKDTSQ